MRPLPSSQSESLGIPAAWASRTKGRQDVSPVKAGWVRDGAGEALVVVADHPRRGAAQPTEEALPIGLRLARERLQAPGLEPSRLKAGRAEDPEGDPEAPASRVAHWERDVVEQQRALLGPGRLPVRLEDDRRKDLDPVADELAVPGQARLAGLRYPPAAAVPARVRSMPPTPTAPPAPTATRASAIPRATNW